MKIPKEVTVEEVDNKLQNLLDSLQPVKLLKVDDIKNVIYHENDLKGSMKIINVFTDFAQTRKQLDLIAEAINLAWNYLPHKSLGGLSPYQKMQEHYYNKRIKKSEIKSPKYNSGKTAVYQLFEDLLPKQIYIKKQREGEWLFVYNQNFHQAHEEFHKFYMSEDLSQIELIEKTMMVIIEEPYLMEANSYLAHLFLRIGEAKKGIEILEKSIEAIKRIFPPEFDWAKDQLPWYFLENRDFLNLLLDRAIFIEKGQGILKSIPYFEQILSLNSNDNQGIRGILATLYLRIGQPQKVIELNKKFPDDATQELIMGNTLALIKLGRVEDAEKHLKKIFKYSKHVIEELLKPTHQQPPDFDPGRIQVGGDDEAYLYWREQGNLWQATRGSMDLLRKITA